MKELEDARAALGKWTAMEEPTYPELSRNGWALYKALRAIFESLSAPPTEDERAAVVKIIDDAADRWKLLAGNHAHRSREARDECMNGRCDGDTTLNGYGFTTNSPAPNRVEFTAEAIIASSAWRNRHREPSAEAIEAAAERLHMRAAGFEGRKSWADTTDRIREAWRESARDALEAAESTRTASTEGSTT